MASQFNFTSLPDLRTLHPREVPQNNILMYQMPTLYSRPHGDGFGPGEVIDNMNGIDVVLCALRHLYSHLDSKFRDNAEIREMEAKNPLLRLAWSEFKQSVTSTAAQNRARQSIAKFLRGIGMANLSYLTIAESRLMHETLLRQEPYQLFDAHPLSQPMEATDNNWDIDDGRRDPAGIAAESLVTWDGLGDLGDVISDKFGIFASDETNRKYLWTFNLPAFVRVHYRAPISNTSSFAKLKEIKIDGKCYQPCGKDGKSIRIRPREQGSTSWVLIMVIRLRKGYEDQDLIRRYTVDGREVINPVSFAYSNVDWKLGESGRQYMLYYAMAPSVDTGVNLPEVLLRPKDYEKKIKMYSDCINAAIALEEEEKKAAEKAAGGSSSQPSGST
ncbi:hypothetical protein F5Y13DRAFT_200936 [Hypoxylon sp. FL1857]|nr:hypothetical protein F5Y13DRAFT_200936 [Hypoxylon sp. FL1857]